MTVSQSLFAFTLAASILALTPGIDTALVLRTAAANGARQAFLAAIGIALGCLVWGGALTLAWFTALIAATVPLGRFLSRPSVMSKLDRLTGGVFIAFGVKLMLSRSQ